MLLALDTATRMMSLALHDGAQVLHEATWHTPNHHTIELAPSVQRVLAAHALAPADLRAVAVAQGPGSFTGLRIGLGFAKGFAVSQGLAFVAVPTLHIVAAASGWFEGELVAVLQAGRGRICVQRFVWQGDRWQPVVPPAIESWEALVDSLDGPALIAGEVNEQGRTVLADAAPAAKVAPAALGLRRAGVLAELAWQRLRDSDTDNPATLTPIYLHQPGVPYP